MGEIYFAGIRDIAGVGVSGGLYIWIRGMVWADFILGAASLMLSSPEKKPIESTK